MNKAKAVFAAVIVTLVAGSSAVLWQLNDKGVLGTPDDENVNTTVSTTVADKNNNSDKDDTEDKTTGTTEASAENNDASSLSTTEINEFLTVFSRAYFSEDKAYSASKADTYELIRFAYTDIKINNASLVTVESADDEIGYYHKVSASEVNKTLKKYFGKTVKEESVFTEKTYSFFRYADGYFYTPVADGIGYANVSIADSVTEDKNMIYVDFSIYSSGVTTDMTSQQARRASEDRYATGKAEIAVNNGEWILRYYEING